MRFPAGQPLLSPTGANMPTLGLGPCCLDTEPRAGCLYAVPTARSTQEQAEGLSTLRTQEQGSERAPMPAQASRGLELPRTGREQPRTPTPTLASSLQSVTVQTGNYPSLSMDRQADCEHLHGRKGTDCRSVQPGLSPKGHTDMCGQQTQKAEHTLCDLRAGSSRAGRRSTGR